MLRILSNTDVESDREKWGKTNSDISTLVPHYNRIRIQISILGANTDTDAKNSDNHFHIPTLTNQIRTCCSTCFSLYIKKSEPAPTTTPRAAPLPIQHEIGVNHRVHHPQCEWAWRLLAARAKPEPRSRRFIFFFLLSSPFSLLLSLLSFFFLFTMPNILGGLVRVPMDNMGVGGAGAPLPPRWLRPWLVARIVAVYLSVHSYSD